ncbi:MAG: EamA family transporter [Desulfarculaceae bacterium]
MGALFQDWRMSVAVVVVSWGLWAFFGKMAVDRLGWPTTAIVGFCVGALLMASWVVPQFRWPGLIQIWPAALYGVFGSLGALMLMRALSQGPVALVLPLSEGYLVISVILAVLFLGEMMNLRRMAGLLLILAGSVFLAGEGSP